MFFRYFRKLINIYKHLFIETIFLPNIALSSSYSVCKNAETMWSDEILADMPSCLGGGESGINIA